MVHAQKRASSARRNGNIADSGTLVYIRTLEPCFPLVVAGVIAVGCNAGETTMYA
jgi:hypothetical protein